MSYQKRVTNKLMDVEGEHEEFGQLIARCNSSSRLNVILLGVFGTLCIAMYNIYIEATPPSKTPSLIVFLCIVAIVIYIIIGCFDEYRFYECGFIRKTLLRPQKEKVAYDEIETFHDRNAWLVGRRTARTHRCWEICLIDTHQLISIDISCYRGVNEVLNAIHQVTGPWTLEK
ncbi:hypothetical protein [Amedibacillus sp. YH-ame10]